MPANPAGHVITAQAWSQSPFGGWLDIMKIKFLANYENLLMVDLCCRTGKKIS